MSTIPEKELIKSTIIKLLEKANRHPSLTPRILRSKLEQRLKLNEGVLKSKRTFIKTTALKWWTAEAPSVEGTSLAIQRLTKLAVAAGRAPAVFKHIANLPEDEKVVVLRSKLRESGLQFSDVPTVAEIDAIKKERDELKDMEGIDTSAIVEGTRKRTTAAAAAAASEDANTGGKPSKKAKIVKADEEEAEF